MAKPDFYKDAPVGRYNAWYFEDIIPGEKECYEGAVKAYYDVNRPLWELNPDKAVLLIIDLQVDVVDPKGKLWMPASTKMLPKLKEVIGFCRAHGIPVIYTAHQAHPSGRDKGLMHTYLTLLQESLIEGQPGAEIHPEIAPQPDEWIIANKRRYDSFWGTELEEVLRTWGRDQIILTGACTNFCCSTTTRSGMQRGFNIAFPYDLNATDDPAVHEEVCKTMNRGFGRVMAADELLTELGEVVNQRRAATG